MKNLVNYILKTEFLSSLDEGLKINSKSKFRKYNYFPKTNKELRELVNQLIEERGEDANLNDIDTSKIINMSNLFSNTKFNGDISRWDVHNVENMEGMFEVSKFNGDISGWDVSKVENISWMFTNSKFNGDISNWDISNVKNMSYMFYNSPLEKNPPKWYMNHK